MIFNMALKSELLFLSFLFYLLILLNFEILFQYKVRYN